MQNNSADAATDRGLPDLSWREKKKSGVTKVFAFGGLIVGLGLLAIFGMIFIKNLEHQRLEKATKEKNNQVEATQIKDFGKEQQEIAKQQALEKQNRPPLPLPKDVAPAHFPAPSAPNAPPPPNRKLQGDVLLASSRATGGAKTATASHYPPPPQQAPGTGGPDNTLDRNLTPSALASVTARQRANLSMLMNRGTIIPCVQQTMITTDNVGMIMCQTVKDVYSANGKTLLIERGSRVTGERRTALQRGQRMIFAIWTHIETPKGVVVNIDSPATNRLGAGGIDAYIDNHWWERFSNAILLTIIGDISSGVKQHYANQGLSGTGMYYPSQSSDMINHMAVEALRSTVNIPPTAYSNQGSMLNVFVARDVDFEAVYDLVAVKNDE